MVLRLSLVISGDASGANKVIADVTTGVAALGTEAKTASGAIGAVTTATNQLADASRLSVQEGKAFAAALADNGGNMEKALATVLAARTATTELGAAQAEAATAAGTLSGATTGAAANMGALGAEEVKTAALTAGVTREFTVLGAEIARGNFSRIPGSLLVLNERLVASGTAALTFENAMGALQALGGVIFNPFVLGFLAISLGIEAASKGFGLLADAVDGGSKRIEADLKAQKTLIDAVKGAYNEANGAASSYGNNSATLLAFEQQQGIATLKSDLAGQQQNLLSGGLFQSNALTPNVGPEGSPLNAVVESFRGELAKGTADVIAFRNLVASIASQQPQGSSTRIFAAAILGDTADAAKTQEELQRAVDLYKGLTGDSQAAATALGRSAEKLQLGGTAAAASLPALQSYDALLAQITAKITDPAAQAAMLAWAGLLPGAATAPVAAPVPVATPSNPYVPGSYEAAASGRVAGFAAGGYTGGLPAHVAAGVVHGQEFVVNAQATARHRPLLEAINAGVRGYASGGYVGGSSAAAGGGYGLFGSLSGDLDTLRGAVSSLGRELVNAKSGLQALGDVVKSVESRFLDAATSSLSDALFGAKGTTGSGLLGGVIANLFGGSGGTGQTFSSPLAWAGIGHTGALIGAAPNGRLAPLSLFAGAPRHHTGTPSLGPGEVPFIGKQGEEIGWPGDLARKYGGGGTTVFNVQTQDAKSFAQSKAMVTRSAYRMLQRARRYS